MTSKILQNRQHNRSDTHMKGQSILPASLYIYMTDFLYAIGELSDSGSIA